MEETKAPAVSLSEDWSTIPWPKLERYVYRLQKRIYQASCHGKTQVVHRLQQLLMQSRAARLLAVRRVTQDNQGKATAGVDGVAKLPPSERLRLVDAITPTDWQPPSPTRRVWIPKPGKSEKRPLGIPTIRDRACQALAKLALEPEWEAKFEPNSYGFRPGRSCHDAIAAIFIAIKARPKYVLDADIKGCFDNISHLALLEKLHTYPKMRQAIKAWLKAGVLEAGEWTPTDQGTPQGGVISPLLANIALHGLETAVTTACSKWNAKVHLIRYADDFVVLCPTSEGVQQAQQVATAWLADMGLWLSPTKTRITHTLTPFQGQVGFDFLGFTIRQFPAGKTQTGLTTWGKPLGHKTFIMPSKAAVQRHLQEIGRIIRTYRTVPQEALIAKLNPVIRGWTNYYRSQSHSYRAFRQCDYVLYMQLRRWARRRHPNKGHIWVARKYWNLTGFPKWKFMASDRCRLQNHRDTRITHYIKVRGRASPYDGNLIYWVQRMQKHPLASSRMGQCLKLQRGRCRICGLYLKPDDLVEVDHIRPLSLGGADTILNLQVIHRHCHDRKTAQDGSQRATTE